MSKRVVIGLSGGVDSSVAAHLLIEQGYEVIAVFMRNWHDESVIIDTQCPWIEDSNDAMMVAEKLNIPFQVLDLSIDYKDRIVDYMFKEYENGRTPNPDILCNREIKYDIFLREAMYLKADYIATGHYCRKDEIKKDGKTIYRLLAGKDNSKDQSYFLCQLNQEQLSKALFPIGELEKSEVRKIAKDLDLVTAEKRDSQGLCFIGKVKLPVFLQQQLAPKKGKIISISQDFEGYKNGSAKNKKEEVKELIYTHGDGEILGEHDGAHYFTVGQRKGLAVGGSKEPLFVLQTDVKENIIYVGEGTEHPGLYRKGLWINESEVHWIREDLKMAEEEERKYMCRIRYRQPLEAATLHQNSEGIYMIFDDPQRGIAKGQFAAWYDGEELIGSGVIS
ncbi:MAG: tRNA 2-thiouridine(34) synthase MnmA [Flavobacteriales bacterium]|nr:tRNA 2-thiouridine(34) synthase MnmA [Flavobacteriales bacterium]